MRLYASRTSQPAIHSPPPKSVPPSPPSSQRLAVPPKTTHSPHSVMIYQNSAPNGLVAKLPNSRRYQLLPQGYSICLLFLKLFERVYAPLTAGLLSPIKADF